MKRKEIRCKFYNVSFLSCLKVHEKCVTCPVCSCLLGHFAGEPAQLAFSEQENRAQHVTSLSNTLASMLRLRWTWALLFWYSLLFHRHALTDEEALWGPTPPRQNPTENKPRSYWGTSSLPKLSLPSLLFSVPFYSSSSSQNEIDALTTAAKGLTEPIDHLHDHSGSGEGSISEASQTPTTLTQGLLTSVTEIRTESLPTGTSDSPHSSRVQSDNDALVADSYSTASSTIRKTLFTNSPTSTNAPGQNVTHTHLPSGTTQGAEPSMGATAQQIPEEHSVSQNTVKMSSTIAPETTVPTALTWAAALTTTTIPGLVEMMLSSRPLSHSIYRTSTETVFIREPQHSTVSLTFHTEEATVPENPPTQNDADLGYLEARSGPVEEQPGVFSTALGLDHKLVLESITSPTQRQEVNFPIAGGKQS